MNLTSPSQVREWCLANGFRPNRTMGQNFLVDLNVLKAIVDAGLAPCAGKCTQEEYRLQVLRALSFLNGDYQAVRDELTVEMKNAAQHLEFEKAAYLRDEIKKLRDTESGRR